MSGGAGRIILGAAGAIIGGIYGGPQGAQAGWMIGQGVGGAIWKPKPIQNIGPMLTDLRVTGIEYGQMIPYTIGHPRIAGQIWWASDRRPVPHTTSQEAGGKGGGQEVQNTTYTYEVDLLIGLTDNEIAGVSRMWFNGKLVYTTLSSSSEASREASLNSELWSTFTVYDGTQTAADPDYIIAKGANAPAYIGRSYAVFKSLDLGPSGNIPVVHFELGAGAAASDATYFYEGDSYAVTLSNNNLKLIADEASNWSVGIENAYSTGKYYCEFIIREMPNVESAITIGLRQNYDGLSFSGGDMGARTIYSPSSLIAPICAYNLNTATPITGHGAVTEDNTGALAAAEGDRVMLAMDFDNHKAWVGKNGTWFNGGNPAAGTNPQWSTLPSVSWRISICGANFTTYTGADRVVIDAAFGGNAFAQLYSAPSGFTTELPKSSADLYGGWNQRNCSVNWQNASGDLSVGGWQTQGSLFIATVGDAHSCGIMKAGRKYYWETVFTGLVTAQAGIARRQDSTVYVLWDSAGTLTASAGITINDASPAGFITGARLCFAFDVDAGKLYIRHGIGAWNNGETDNPQNGTADAEGIPANAMGWCAFGAVNTSASWTLAHPDDMLGDAPAGYEAGIPMIDTDSITVDGTELQNISVADAVAQLCERAGLTSAQYDVSGLENITRQIRGIAISEVSPTRTVLEMLGATFFFDCVMSGEQVKFVERGSAVAATFDHDELAVVAEGSEAPDPFTLSIESEPEVPAQLLLRYPCFEQDYQPDAVPSDRLTTSIDKSPAEVQVPVVMTAAEAKGVVDAMLLDQYISLVGSQISIFAHEYAELEPTDCVGVTDQDGNVLRMRIIEREDNGPVAFLRVVRDDATILESLQIASADYSSSIEVAPPVDTIAVYLDIPILRDADDYPMIYGAGMGDGTPFPGAVFLRATDDVNFDVLETLTESTVIGDCVSTLPDWTGGAIFDETSWVDVDVGEKTLTATTSAAILNSADENAYAIGAHGRWEIGQFRNPELLSTSPNIYRLTGLLRGRRGTEWACLNHRSDDKFVLLQMSGLRVLELNNSQLGIDLYYRAVTIGRRLSTAASQTINAQGVYAMPFAPVAMHAERNESTGDITFTWQRRTRRSVRMTGELGISIPLGETTEEYEIDILAPGSPAVVLRTLLAEDEETMQYTLAQQITDYGSPLTSSVRFALYQLSETVGRGYACEGTIYL